MTNKPQVGDELLNAFVDGELDSAEKSRLLGMIAASDELKNRVCELWQLKEMIGSAYPRTAAPHSARRAARFLSPHLTHSLAAGVFLAIGLTTGWFVHGMRGAPPAPLLMQASVQPAKHESKVVLHIFSGESVRFEAALDQAEELMRSADKLGNHVQLDVVANSEGLRLLQADASPYPQRIKDMQQTYKNLNFYACGITIDKLRRRGVNVQLLPEAVITPSALDLIMTREKQGWLYIQV